MMKIFGIRGAVRPQLCKQRLPLRDVVLVQKSPPRSFDPKPQAFSSKHTTNPRKGQA